MDRLKTFPTCPYCGSIADPEVITRKTETTKCNLCHREFNVAEQWEKLPLLVAHDFDIESVPGSELKYQNTVDGLYVKKGVRDFVFSGMLFLIAVGMGYAAGNRYEKYWLYDHLEDLIPVVACALVGVAVLGLSIYFLFGKFRLTYEKLSGKFSVFNGAFGIGRRYSFFASEATAVTIEGHFTARSSGNSSKRYEVLMVKCKDGRDIEFGRYLGRTEQVYLAYLIRKCVGDFTGIDNRESECGVSKKEYARLVGAAYSEDDDDDEYTDIPDEELTPEFLAQEKKNADFWVPHSFKPAEMPKGVCVDKTADGVVITARCMNLGNAVILGVFTLVMTMAVFAGCYGYQIANGYDQTTTLVGIPLLIVCFFMWVRTLYWLIGKVKVTVTPQTLSVFCGFWFWSSRKNFNTADVTAFDKDKEVKNKVTWEVIKRSMLRVKMASGDYVFGKYLEEDQKNYIRDAVRSMMQAV